MSDRYDRAIAYLTEHPDEIQDAWCVPTYHCNAELRQAHDLFLYATPSGNREERDGLECGCLSLIRSEVGVAWTDALTEAIRADARIPIDERKVTVQDLPVFAEWQRKLDRELNRVEVA